MMLERLQCGLTGPARLMRPVLRVQVRVLRVLRVPRVRRGDPRSAARVAPRMPGAYPEPRERTAGEL